MKKPTLSVSLIPIIFLVSLLTLNVIVYGDNSSYGPNQMALFFSSFVAMVIGKYVLKLRYRDLEKKALESVGVALQAILILLVVGSLIAMWILNGVVPSMIYYGIKMISPEVFLPVTLIICSIVSLATGSSWSTVGTVGIALIGIGKTIGIPDGMVAGAIVSGSYFGDKMSPLSETTNLAPAMAGTDLFSHIRHMTYTTGWAYGFTLLIFIGISFFYQGDLIDKTQIEQVLKVMDDHFYISPILFTLPLIVIVMVTKRVPAVPALIVGVILGGVYALVFQGDLLHKVLGANSSFSDAYEYILKISFDGFKMSSGNEVIDKLFSRGGMSSMLNTIWLILMAMIFGGMMESTGMLNTISESILKMVHGVGSLVGATVGTAIFLNTTTSDQYISIVVSARMFKDAYKKFNLHPKNLSRAVEDGGTVTSVLVPWNTCGAYFSSIMGVATFTYLPFAFFNLLTPIISVIVASTGKTMERLKNEEEKA